MTPVPHQSADTDELECQWIMLRWGVSEALAREIVKVNNLRIGGTRAIDDDSPTAT